MVSSRSSTHVDIYQDRGVREPRGEPRAESYYDNHSHDIDRDELDQHAPSPDGHKSHGEVEDPFEDSADEDRDGRPAVGSIEQPYSKARRQIKHGCDRSFSAKTAICLDDEDDPQFDDEYGHDGVHDEGSDERGDLICDSDSFSALPDQLETLDANQTPFSHYLTPSSKAGGGVGYGPGTNERRSSPLRERERNLSSPSRDRMLSQTSSRPASRLLSTPQRFNILSTPHSRTTSTPHDRPVFRNSSSVRRMQLSSSSPPPFSSSRSARHRRNETNPSSSRSGTPSHHLHHNPTYLNATPTYQPHPNPNKEYPLILLHCSINTIFLPYSSEILTSVLPKWIQEDMQLLERKLGSKMLERGILITHPGEDYELLEERILESLEVVAKRVGGCGHFLGGILGKDMEIKNENGGKMVESHAEREMSSDRYNDPTCDDCGRHISNGLHGTSIHHNAGANLDDVQRRWDVKVYAANGLMRAGAWSAAWKEMEKVDVEIGVWIPEDVRRRLDEAAATEEKDIAARYRAQPSDLEERNNHFHAVPPSKATTSAAIRGMETGAASTAACSRPGSRHKQSQAESPKWPKQRDAKEQKQLPLSTLLVQYVKRTLTRPWNVALQILILALGVVWLTRRSSPTALFNPLDGIAAVAKEQLQHLSSFGEADVPSTEKQRDMAAHWEWQTPLPACTFKLGEEGAGMMVLPSDVASQVLRALPAVTAPPEASTEGGSETSTTSGLLAATAEDSENGEEGTDDRTVREGFVEIAGEVVDALVGDGEEEAA